MLPFKTHYRRLLLGLGLATVLLLLQLESTSCFNSRTASQTKNRFIKSIYHAYHTQRVAR